MTANTFLHIGAATVAFFLVTASQAAVSITTERHPTSGLPSYTTAVLTAISDNPAEPILGFDFAGELENNNPQSGYGFFGPLNQVNPFGTQVIYSAYWPVIFIVPQDSPSHDSHFLVDIRSSFLALPAFSQEGPDILQGVWAYPAPQGLAISFAQLVIPNTDTDGVFFRGFVGVGPHAGSSRLVEVSGYVFVPEPCSLLIVLTGTVAVGVLGHRSRLRTKTV